MGIHARTPLRRAINISGSRVVADELQRLCQGVVIQAAKDALRGDLDAAAWLKDPETSETWLRLAGVDDQAVQRWVEAGCKPWGSRKMIDQHLKNKSAL